MFDAQCLVNPPKLSQKLLFDIAPTIRSFSTSQYSVPNKYYNDGYVILDDITDEQLVTEVLYEFVKALSPNKLSITQRVLDSVQLATVNYIPNCDEIISTGFQALHFDMGQPFLAKGVQPMYMINALYRPLTSATNMQGKTRIVNISKLGKQKQFGSQDVVKDRLTQYVLAYGDGWRQPASVNTYRLACFARFIDAISGLNELTDKIDTQIGQCFEYDSNKNGHAGLQREYQFFRKAGLDLASIEEQIVIKPGQLLIIDNTRCVHGRIGPRKSRELLNVLFAIPSVSKTTIEHFSDSLVAAFSY